MIIAIDGPAGTGKGTVSKLISDRLGYIYIDTGAMYRAIALKIIRNNIKLEDIDKIESLLENTDLEFRNIEGEQKIFLDGEDVSKEIRSSEVNNTVAPMSNIKSIRVKLVELQRDMAVDNDIIMEGRDITTVVFPNAEVKVYLTADLEERARRRYKELIEKGMDITYEDVYDNVKKRDENDMTKEMGALKVAEDAIFIDSTNMTIDDVCEEILKYIMESKMK